MAMLVYRRVVGSMGEWFWMILGHDQGVTHPSVAAEKMSFYIQGIRKVVFHPQFCTQRRSMNCLSCFKETLPKPYYLISSTVAGWVSWLVIKYDVGSTIGFHHHISSPLCRHIFWNMFFFSISEFKSDFLSWGGFFQTSLREETGWFFSTESMRSCQVIPTPIAENEEKEKESKWGQHWQTFVAVAVVPSLSIASMY